MKDVDEKIEQLIANTKGRYVTQGVAFNKTCPRQMELLRFALSDSVSFSGLMKELLAIRMNATQTNTINTYQKPHMEQLNTPKSKNVGNFI